LIRGHHIEITIGLDVEHAQDLIEHLPVLARDADADMKELVPKQLPKHGRYLDRFGTHPEDEHHPTRFVHRMMRIACADCAPSPSYFTVTVARLLMRPPHLL
jgi:hypothetical protein